MSKGIDYGMGQTNVDKKTGIRYGVISINDLVHWAHDNFEPDYGEPTCGKCGNEAEEYDDEKHGEYESDHGCNDYACEGCERVFDSSDAYSEEPLGWTLDDGEYQASLGSDNDVFLVKSPYYTHAQFCSPCAPGAGHLGNPCEDGVRTYCFDKSWFPDNIAPYPVYCVKTGKLVE